MICRSEYTRGLHTQGYLDGGEENTAEVTNIYCIDLGSLDGASLVGKELTVRLLYAEEGEGFVSSFTPETCFTGRSWRIDRTCEFQGHRITLNEVRESALYVTLFIDCDDIGHAGDELEFLLSDELDNAYFTYPYGDVSEDGYWFTKPEAMGRELTLKVMIPLIFSRWIVVCFEIGFRKIKNAGFHFYIRGESVSITAAVKAAAVFPGMIKKRIIITREDNTGKEVHIFLTNSSDYFREFIQN